jgi:LPS O-antigen subunit length determinant protein (WzzB/FepE family)
MSNETNKRMNVGEIDFIAIFAIFWRRRKLILFGTLAATLLAVALSFFIPKTYRSEGFYQLGNPENKITTRTTRFYRQDNEKKEIKLNVDEENSQRNNVVGIPITLYKKSAPQFFNPTHLYLFASQKKAFSNQEKEFSFIDSNYIKTNFQNAANINAWIVPVFAFSKGDLRDLVQIPKDISNSVLGLNLSYEADSPQQAYNYVRFFGYYIRDCLLYVSLYDYIKNEYSKVISELSENENDIIDLQFNLQQNTRKMSDIKAILTKYPEAAKIENRQVVSVQEGGFRFLGPVTQLVGIESTLADQRQYFAELEREKEKLIIRREYFSKCNDALNKSSSQGGAIFSQLKSIKSTVFENKDFHKGTVKDVFNNLNIDLQVFDLAFFTNCRFISGPTFPDQHIKPQKRVIVASTCFLSFLFFIFLTLVWHLWQNNKKKIEALIFKEKA